MNISKLKLVLKYLTGGVDSVVEYLLGVVNKALAAIDAGNKAKIQAAVNTIQRVLAALNAFAWLCPTKWQNAYTATAVALADILSAVSDLEITADEIDVVRSRLVSAVMAWRSPEGEKDIDFTSTAAE